MFSEIVNIIINQTPEQRLAGSIIMFVIALLLFLVICAFFYKDKNNL